MNGAPEASQVSAQWVEKAEHDLRNADLTPHAIEARYPGSWEPQTREDALRAVTVARRVRDAARDLLPGGILP